MSQYLDAKRGLMHSLVFEIDVKQDLQHVKRDLLTQAYLNTAVVALSFAKVLAKESAHDNSSSSRTSVAAYVTGCVV